MRQYDDTSAPQEDSLSSQYHYIIPSDDRGKNFPRFYYIIKWQNSKIKSYVASVIFIRICLRNYRQLSRYEPYGSAFPAAHFSFSPSLLSCVF